MGSRPEQRTPLTDILVTRIGRDGPLTFADFMETCLYHPEYGYYMRKKPEEGASDYFTSPEVGPLFGRLLARQVREMWEVMARPSPFTLIECGAGCGRLSEQILTAATEQAPAFGLALRLWLVERSPQLREQAQAALAKFGNRVHVSAELPSQPPVGCVLSNELLDALPVHRVVQRGERLREIYICVRAGGLAEAEGEPSSPAVSDYLERYGAPLEDGQQAEVHLAALAWLEEAVAALARGFLLTIDYGYRAHELYVPHHLRGTLLAYRQHRAHEDWLAWPGEQDLTAHVNFTALEKRGQELGLETLGFTQQASFLLALARASEFADIEGPGGGDCEKLARRQALKQLIHPGGMGETFKVLIQGKGFSGARLSGLEPL